MFSTVFLFLGFTIILCQNETEAPPTNSGEYNPVLSDKRCLPGCTFERNTLLSSTLNLFPKNCSTVCAPYGLRFGSEMDLGPTIMTETLKNVKLLLGALVISRTSFKNCSFFENLESIDCYNEASIVIQLNGNMTEIGMPRLGKVACMVSIGGNYNLTRLNLPNMMPAYSVYAPYKVLEVELNDNSKEFCVTIEEMENFMKYNTVLDRLRRTTGKYCEISNTSTFPQKTCDLGKIGLKSLESDCVNLRGDVLIGPGDEGYVSKLALVEIIFGRLQIIGTNLTNINFLASLQKVMALAENLETIIVENNPSLSNVSLPSLKRILATVHNPIIFNNNSQVLMKDPDYCYGIFNKLDKDAPWLVKFDGHVCEDIEKYFAPVKDNSSDSVFQDVLVLIGVLLARVMWR